MRFALRHYLVAVAIAAFATSCGPPWKVIKASGPPSALEGKTDVGVAFDYSELVVDGKPLSQWMELKTKEDPKYPETWANLMGKFETGVMSTFSSGFAGAHLATQSPGAAQVIVSVKTFQMGKYIVIGQIPTVMNVHIQGKVGEAVTDEIMITRSFPASVVQPSVFNHVPHVGEQVGNVAAQFMNAAQPKK
ncbi:MAG: hypothetical protein U0228_06285 [Myxococcaceae bacterium]